MPTTSRYAITLMATSALNKETLFNEAVVILEALSNPFVLSYTTTAPPGSPTVGDIYIVPAGATGDWAGQDQKITIWTGTWRFIDPVEGLFVWIDDVSNTYRYDSVGGTWVQNALTITSINSLPDVDTAGAVAGSILRWNGTDTWTVQPVALDDLSDLDVSGATDGQILSFNNTSGNWEAIDLPSTDGATIESTLDTYFGSTTWRDGLDGATIKARYEAETNTNAFTDAEKSKLAGLNDNLYLGIYADLTALQTAHPSPVAGSFAYIDAGAATDIELWIWDDTDSQYVQGGGTGTETPASIKSKYESNADTNAFTDALLTKLTNIETNAKDDQTAAEIEALLDAYFGNTDWRTSGGASTFLALTDTPGAFTGEAGNAVIVNATENGLEFGVAPGGGGGSNGVQTATYLTRSKYTLSADQNTTGFNSGVVVAFDTLDAGFADQGFTVTGGEFTIPPEMNGKLLTLMSYVRTNSDGSDYHNTYFQIDTGGGFSTWSSDEDYTSVSFGDKTALSTPIKVSTGDVVRVLYRCADNTLILTGGVGPDVTELFLTVEEEVSIGGDNAIWTETLTNWDFETGDASGWTVDTGTASVVLLSGGSAGTPSITSEQNRGGLYIIDGGSQASCSLYQEYTFTQNDVMFSFQSVIEADDPSVNDTITVTVEQRDASNNVLGTNSWSEGQNGSVQLIDQLITRIPEATKIRVTIDFSRGVSGSFINAYCGFASLRRLEGTAFANAPGFKGFSAVADGTQAALNASIQTITCQTEEFDSDNAYDPVTGIFTVPASLNGEWMSFAGGVRRNNTNGTLYIYKDGASISQSGGSGNDRNNVVSKPIQVSTGETYSLRWFGTGTESFEATNTWFSGRVHGGAAGGGSGGGGGSSDFLGLTDTPANFTDAENNIVFVNSAGDNLEFRPTAQPDTSYANEGGTGDRQASITASTTLALAGTSGPISNAVDGGTGNNSTDSWWVNSQSVAGLEIKFQFLTAKRIDEATWRQDTTDTHGVWKWQGSNNDADWTDLSSEFTLGGVSQAQAFDLFDNNVGYTYFRLLGVSGTTSTTPYLQETDFRIADFFSNVYDPTIGLPSRLSDLSDFDTDIDLMANPTDIGRLLGVKSDGGGGAIFGVLDTNFSVNPLGGGAELIIDYDHSIDGNQGTFDIPNADKYPGGIYVIARGLELTGDLRYYVSDDSGGTVETFNYSRGVVANGPTIVKADGSANNLAGINNNVDCMGTLRFEGMGLGGKMMSVQRWNNADSDVVNWSQDVIDVQNINHIRLEVLASGNVTAGKLMVIGYKANIQPMSVQFDYSGSPAAVETLSRYVAPIDMQIAIGASGAFSVDTAPTTAATINIKQNGSTIGTITVAITTGDCTVNITATTNITKGDVIILESDGSEDFTDLYGALFMVARDA